jgi:ubiquinone biosynthesis accessory factor UbiJ
MAGTAMNLHSTALSWLENTVNRYVALDPEFPRRLDALQGKTVRLEISGLDLDVYLKIEQRRILLLNSTDAGCDLVIRGTPLGLLALLRAEDPLEQVHSGTVELKGDMQLARDLKNIFALLDIDWEELLARGLGDWPARQIGILARRFGQWRERSHESVQRSVGEYLQEESRLLPARIEIENFITEVDAMREALDRLEARMNYQQAPSAEHRVDQE